MSGNDGGGMMGAHGNAERLGILDLDLDARYGLPDPSGATCSPVSSKSAACSPASVMPTSSMVCR